MSIDYRDYHPKWSLIRRLVLRRAGDTCEWCGVPNHARGWWTSYRALKRFVDVGAGSFDDPGVPPDVKIIDIVLTIAHLDQNKRNNRFRNLAALCQRCHLGHDRSHHERNRMYGRDPSQLGFDLPVDLLVPQLIYVAGRPVWLGSLSRSTPGAYEIRPVERPRSASPEYPARMSGPWPA